jgi:hypothetical protein
MLRKLPTRKKLVSRVTGESSYLDANFIEEVPYKTGPPHQRAGDVVMRYEEDTVLFTQLPNNVANLFPAVSVHGVPLDSRSIETTLPLPRGREVVFGALATTAFGALGLATAELTTSGHVMHDVIGFSAGAIARSLPGRLKKARNNIKTGQLLNLAEAQFDDSHEYVKLPRTAKLDIVQDDEFMDGISTISLGGIETTVKNGDMLNFANTLQEFPMNDSMNGDKSWINKDLALINVDLDDSLWSNYIREHGSVFDVFIEDLEPFKAARYLQGVGKMAQRFGVTAKPAEPPLKNKKKLLSKAERTALAKKTFDLKPDEFDFSKWKDASFASILIAPAKLVENLLARSKNPDWWWREVEATLSKIPAYIEQKDAALAQLESRKKLLKHAKQNQNTDEELPQLEDASRTARRTLYASYVEIIGVWQRINQVEEYNETKAELLELFGDTGAADEQHQAIRLMDIVFNAYLRIAVPDSQEAIKLGERVRGYMKATFPELKYNQGNIIILYDGIRKKFPELQLPEVMPL